MDPATASIAAGAVSSASSGLFGVLSQFLANRQASKNIADQASYDRSLAEYQFDRNYQMWQEQNAYNSPAAQMDRLKAAGLNPNLAYGSLGSSVATSAPQFDQRNNVQYSQRPGYSIPDVIGMYQNFRQNDLTARNTLARTRNIQEQTASEVIRRGLISSQKIGQDLNNAYERAVMNTRITLQKLGIPEKEANIRVSKMRASQLQAQADMLRYQLNFARASQDLNLRLLSEQILSHQSNRALNAANIGLIGERKIGVIGDNRYLGNYLSDYDQFMYQRGLSNFGKNYLGAPVVTFAHGLSNRISKVGKWLKNKFNR